ncbi:MAG: GAF domain-containing sensor histidine kinase, partial [Elusimicrobiota bacterium]
LSFIEEDGARLVVRWCKAGYGATALKAGYGAGLAGSSLQGMLLSGKARIIGDLEDYLRARPGSESTRILVQEGVRCSLTLPLEAGGRPVGLLFLSSREPRALGVEHARILSQVREHIAQAVERAWLKKSLEDAKRDYFSTLGFISHELKNPLASIMARAESYMGGVFGKVDPKVEESMRSMLNTASDMTGMVENYLGLAGLETGELAISRESIHFDKEFFLRLLEETEALASRRGRHIAVDIPSEEMRVRGGVDLLRIALRNLLHNAVKYGFEGTEIRVRARVSAGWLEVSVRNAGVGFRPEEKGKLFRKFSRLRQAGTEKTRGSGLGLYLSWLIAQRHGGSLSAESESGKWAEFTLRLPDASLG